MLAVSPERRLPPFLDQILFIEQITVRLSLVCLIMLVVAASIWLTVGRERQGYKVAAVYWLACGMGVLLTLHLPLDRVLAVASVAIAAVSLVFAYLPYWHHKRKRRKTWFEDLGRLVRPFRAAPGLTTSVTALALLVFFLNLCYVTSVLSLMSAAMMGAALLILADHGFREEAAFAGIILISQALVCGLLVVCGGSARSVPTVVNLTMVMLGVLAWFWTWLGNVWRQQILDGEPLTTAARMVPLTVHAGVMMLGFASLLLFELAIWPEMPQVAGFDNAGPRLCLLAVGGVVLLAVNFRLAARRTPPAMGVVFMFNVFALVLAYVLRAPWFRGHVIMPYLPIWAIVMGLTYLVLAVVFRKGGCPGLARPAAFVAQVICPVGILFATVRQGHGLTGWGIAAAGAVLVVAWGVLRGTPANVEPARSKT